MLHNVFGLKLKKYCIEIFNINIQIFFFFEILKYLVEIFNINIQSYFFSMQFLNIQCKYSKQIFKYIFFL